MNSSRPRWGGGPKPVHRVPRTTKRAPIPLNVKASPLCAAVGRPAIEKKLLFSLIANTSAGILSVETPPRTTLEDTMSILPVP